MIRIFLLIVLFSCFACNNKNGWELLNQAEQKLENKETKGTLKLIKKAKSADYGFCGNAYIEADLKVNYLLGKYYLLKKDTSTALQNLLPSVFYTHFADNTEIIDLTFSILQKQHSNSFLNKEFTTAAKNFKTSISDEGIEKHSINFMNAQIPFWTFSYDTLTSNESIIEELMDSKFAKRINNTLH